MALAGSSTLTKGITAWSTAVTSTALRLAPAFFPSDSLGIVVLSNQDGSVVPSIVRNLITDRLLNLKYHDWNSDLKNAANKGKEGRDKAEKDKEKTVVKHNPATHPLADYAGNYNNKGYGTMKLYLNKDSLFVKTFSHTLWLRHANYDIFDVLDKDPREGIDTSETEGVKDPV